MIIYGFCLLKVKENNNNKNKNRNKKTYDVYCEKYYSYVLVRF